MTLTGKGDYFGTVKGSFKITLASIAGAKLGLSAASFTYNGKVQVPTVTTVGGKKLKAGADYELKYSNAKSSKAGTYQVWVVGKGNYAGTSAKASYKILNVNPVTVQVLAPSTTLAKVKKTNQVLAASKAFKVSGNKGGTPTYKKAFGDKKVTVAKSGKVTVVKGAKKGTHTVKVKVDFPAKGNYAATSKTVTLKVKVK